MSEKLQWTLIVLYFVVVGVLVWVTGNLLFSLLWLVGLIFVGLGVTGVLGSLFGKKSTPVQPTQTFDNAGGREND